MRNSAVTGHDDATGCNRPEDTSCCLDCGRRLVARSVECDGCHWWLCLECLSFDSATYDFIGKKLATKACKILCKRCSTIFDYYFPPLPEGIPCQKKLPTLRLVQPREPEIAVATGETTTVNGSLMGQRLPGDISEYVDSRVKMEMQSIDDYNRRRNNLVFYGIPEELDDLNRVKEILMAMGFPDMTPEDCTRLGKKQDRGNRPTARPLLAVMRSPWERRLVLRITNLLKGHRTFGRVFVRPDLPREVREKRKQQWDERVRGAQNSRFGAQGHIQDTQQDTVVQSTTSEMATTYTSDNTGESWNSVGNGKERKRQRNLVSPAISRENPQRGGKVIAIPGSHRSASVDPSRSNNRFNVLEDQENLDRDRVDAVVAAKNNANT